jgi:hypothetical protein
LRLLELLVVASVLSALPVPGAAGSVIIELPPCRQGLSADCPTTPTEITAGGSWTFSSFGGTITTPPASWILAPTASDLLLESLSSAKFNAVWFESGSFVGSLTLLTTLGSIASVTADSSIDFVAELGQAVPAFTLQGIPPILSDHYGIQSFAMFLFRDSTADATPVLRITPIPEPSTLSLVLVGMGILVLKVRGGGLTRHWS